MTKTEVFLAALMSINALIQFILDLILEILHLIPTRVNHLSLTVLNAFVSWKTLSAIQKKKFRFVHEDVQTLFILEICLIVGDLYYFFYDDFNIYFLLVRLFFLICSTFNLFVVIYIIWKHGLWHLSYQGDGGEKGRELVRRATQRFRRSISISFDKNEISKELEMDFLAKEKERKQLQTIAEPMVEADQASIGEPDSDEEDDDDEGGEGLDQERSGLTRIGEDDDLENGEGLAKDESEKKIDQN